MREPVVLSGDDVSAEVERLGAELRAARERCGLTTREVTTRAGMAHSALWRVETAQHPPTFLSLARLAEAVDATLELDGTRPARRLPPGQGWPLPPGYLLGRAVVEAEWSPEKKQLHSRMHSVRVRLGAELWWARYAELAEPLDGESVCRLLGISHHTLSAVEFGPKWPDLASVIRVAGLTGRHLVLTPTELGLRVPTWVVA